VRAPAPPYLPALTVTYCGAPESASEIAPSFISTAPFSPYRLTSCSDPFASTGMLTTLREKLIKIGAKVVHHARYVTFQLAEVAIPRRLYGMILERIRRFAARPATAAPG